MADNFKKNLKEIDRILETQNLEQLYPVLESLRATPGWHKKRASLWKEPRTDYQPMLWNGLVCRAALEHAGPWIGMDQAERRNLMLFNPVGDNDYDSVCTIVSAYQMIKPGEYARTHRHTPNAMRLILDAQPGCFTVVNGTKLPMLTGDFLLTPSGCWHSHYNEGSSNAHWIDFLDVPLVHRLQAMLFEELTTKQSVESEPNQHPWYFPERMTRPLLFDQPTIDGYQRLILPVTEHIPSLQVSYLALQANTSITLSRDTASRIFAITAGSGHAQIGNREFDWYRSDVLAAPIWTECRFTADEFSIMLEVSDMPTLKKLGFYRRVDATH